MGTALVCVRVKRPPGIGAVYLASNPRALRQAPTMCCRESDHHGRMGKIVGPRHGVNNTTTRNLQWTVLLKQSLAPLAST
jgi:hypothetical protein